MKVELVYAGLHQQKMVTMDVAPPKTILEIIQISKIVEEFPEIDLHKLKVGVFGKVKSLDTPVVAGDRIEIYRPLIIDPKEARRARAKN